MKKIIIILFSLFLINNQANAIIFSFGVGKSYVKDKQYGFNDTHNMYFIRLGSMYFDCSFGEYLKEFSKDTETCEWFYGVYGKNEEYSKFKSESFRNKNIGLSENFTDYYSAEHDKRLKCEHFNIGLLFPIPLEKNRNVQLHLGGVIGYFNIDGDKHWCYSSHSWYSHGKKVISISDGDMFYGVDNEWKFNYGLIGGLQIKCFYVQGKITKYTKDISIGFCFGKKNFSDFK